MAQGGTRAGRAAELSLLAVSPWTSEDLWLRISADQQTIVYALLDPDVYPLGWQHEKVKFTPRIKLPFLAKEWVGHWNVFRISRNPMGVYFSAAVHRRLRGIGRFAHMPRYEYLTLEKTDLLQKGIWGNQNDRISVAKSPMGSDGKPIWDVPLALMKIVTFPGELYQGLDLTKRMNVEIRVHERAARFGYAPRFIGLVGESSRVMGYLSEFLPEAKSFLEIGNDLIKEDVESVSRLLAKLHAVGIAHGDLHPGNILRDGDGTVMLVDFEMAQTRENCENPEQFNAYARWERQRWNKDRLSWLR